MQPSCSDGIICQRHVPYQLKAVPVDVMKPNQTDLIEKVLCRGARGSRDDMERAIDLSLALLRYECDCLSDSDNRWLSQSEA